MLTVWKLDEPSIFVIFRPKEDLSCRSTLSTDALFFALQTTANVATFWYESVAWYVTSWSVTHLTALLGTSVMRTLPGAFLTARYTRLSTFIRASTVLALVFTHRDTGRTRLSTQGLARMGTNLNTTTLQLAPFVNATHATLTTSSRTRVTTFQRGSARNWTISKSC